MNCWLPCPSAAPPGWRSSTRPTRNCRCSTMWTGGRRDRADLFYLHAQWKRESRRRPQPAGLNLTGAGNYVLLDTVGRTFRRLQLSIVNLTGGWWARGRHVFVDGQSFRPTCTAPHRGLLRPRLRHAAHQPSTMGQPLGALAWPAGVSGGGRAGSLLPLAPTDPCPSPSPWS